MACTISRSNEDLIAEQNEATRRGSTRTTSTSVDGCGAATSTSKTSQQRPSTSRWPFRHGALGRAGPASRGFPDRASRATSSKSSKTARTIFNLVRSTPAVSLHIPWDKPDDAGQLC